ncbi:Alpha/Beta hydrolase protein [Halteromyces radiatus]|uniref:Alpha/Beta hydrolase protein n=1 Tax=Halteromyces radiatus TaxID=101107 RepID=UPI00221FE1A4|nr:Alpha/Beta hydrolase protein [Halteromyces radiatus]KAI8093832.1 Alpha/Beta hydrolase protein [Halteromyces radiatus]
MFEELAQRHGLRMIWPERPGYGLSEECSPQKLNALDWAEVVIQLANHLGINTFSIIGQSVGTVFAMAIAHQYSHRVMGPMYMISPWVSTQQANTFKWSRRLPASLVTRTLSFAMDVMWLFNKPTAWDSSTDINSPPLQSPPPLFSSSSTTTTSSSISYGQHIQQQEEENEFLASLEGEDNLPTDFPPHRPLRHMVRPRHVSLYVAMNKYRMAEPYQSGQLGDVLVALEKYHEFGFSYDGQSTPVAVSAVWGDQDSLIPQRAIDCFANQIRDIRLKILEGEGHDLIWKEGVMAWAIRSIGERWRATEGRSS